VNFTLEFGETAGIGLSGRLGRAERMCVFTQGRRKQRAIEFASTFRPRPAEAIQTKRRSK